MIKVYEVYNKFTGTVLKETLSETEAYKEQDIKNANNTDYSQQNAWAITSRFMDDSYKSIFED